MILGSSVWCSKLYLPCMDGGTCVYMQEAYVHAGAEEGAVSIGPGPMETLLEGWNEFSRKSTLGCAGIIMTYLIILFWFSWIYFCIH